MEVEKNKPNIAIARKAARNLIEACRIKDPPVLLRDVLAHLKKSKDLKVLAADLGKKTDGIQITSEDTAVIGYNEAKHVHRQRFTVAHELGHFVLGHTQAGYDKDIDSNNKEEVEANQFAAELLMPLAMLKKDFEQYIKNPDILADRYNVSKDAMWIRLLECKLVSKM